MANRQTTFLLKRSNVPGKIPPSSGLTSGELALNTADAILYTSGSTANQILPIGWDRIHRTGDTVFGDFAISGSSLPSGYALSVTGDTNFVGDILVEGNVGIGTISPREKLDVSGNTIITGNLTVSGITGTTWFSGNSSSDLVRITQTGSGNAFVVEDNTNPDSSPFVIDASGNTGIGTTTPSAKLDVSSNGGRLRLSQNIIGNVFNGIDFVSYVGGVNGSLISNQFTGELRLFTGPTYFPTFYSSGNEIMRISTSGNVGIGTISPREKLDVSGNTIISSGLSASTVTITTQPTSGYTATQILMRNSTSGQVEITNSTSPSIYNYGMSYAMTTFNYLT